jgi:hypothetical protein
MFFGKSWKWKDGCDEKPPLEYRIHFLIDLALQHSLMSDHVVGTPENIIMKQAFEIFFCDRTNAIEQEVEKLWEKHVKKLALKTKYSKHEPKDYFKKLASHAKSSAEAFLLNLLSPDFHINNPTGTKHPSKIKNISDLSLLQIYELLNISNSKSHAIGFPCTRNKTTFLHIAAALGKNAMFDLPIIKDPGIGLRNVIDIFGYTPLMYAVKFKQYETIAFLMQRGAKPSLGLYDGVSPLKLAIVLDDSKSVQLLTQVEKIKANKSRPYLSEYLGNETQSVAEEQIKATQLQHH